jgi:hypothetical protein
VALNRAKFDQQRTQYQNEKPQFGTRFVGKGIIKLRVLEFQDQDGDNIFARKYVQWNRPSTGKPQSVSVDRFAVWGLPDAYEQYQHYIEANGGEFPFKRRGQWAIKAIDLSQPQKKIETFIVANSVWEDISAYAQDPQWQDILEYDTGYPFKIEGTGDGFDRQYAVTVDRNPWPVPPDLQNVTDPLYDGTIKDPGLEQQCRQLGVSLEDLWGDAVATLEGIDPVTPEIQAPPPRTVSRMAASASPVARPGAGPARPTQNTPPARPVPPVAAPNKPRPGGLLGGLIRR